VIFPFLRAARHVSKVGRLFIDPNLDIRIGVRRLFEIMREHAVAHVTLLRGIWSGMRKSENRFSARIPLYTLGIYHVHDFGLIRSKIIVF
jgi:hypothetical protein